MAANRWAALRSRSRGNRSRLATTTPIAHPIKGAGLRGIHLAIRIELTTTLVPIINGSSRVPEMRSTSEINWPRGDPARLGVNPMMTSSCENRIRPPIPQEKPVTTACGTWVIETPHAEHAKYDHEDRRHQADFGGAPDALLLHGGFDKGNGDATRTPNQEGIAAQKSRRRSGQNRRENSQDRWQPHEGCHRQTVRQRDQCRD